MVVTANLSLMPEAKRLELYEGERIVVPANASHEIWDALLKKYVDDQGLVAYGDWKKSQADLTALDVYLKRFAEKPQTLASGNDEAASLINLYNATTIRWVLANYPVESIMALKDSFGVQRLDVGGRKASLNEIEHGTLRPLLGYRSHTLLVCATRSCPPLQRFAYTPSHLDEQVDTAHRAWLAREDLNRFSPDQKKIEISSIFSWFKDDFEKAGGVKNILIKYAPQQYQDFLADGNYEISYLPYNWGLNQMIWNSIIDAFRIWK